MMAAKDRRIESVAIAVALLASLLSSCQPCAPIWGPGYPDMGCGAADCGDCGKKSDKDKEWTVKDLAAAIDSLEKHIEKFGSIVPKHADVWGQARLTAYRQEFERVMRADIYLFQPTIQATIRASDQAFLANALSLSAGVQGATAPAAANAMSLLASPNDAITRNNLVASSTISNYVTPTGKLALEPTLLEDQKRRYLDHLNQLRRNNQGDDNTDAPGYALYLMRFPISILTGGCTQTGYGGEWTLTATPHLPDDLLPQTFRDLVVNDLVKLLTLPITRLIDQVSFEDLQKYLEDYEKGEVTIRKELNAVHRKELDDARNRLLYARLARVLDHVTPASTRRVNQIPIPTSQLSAIVGAHNLAYLAQHVRKQIRDHMACKNAPYHLDVQAVLRNELGAAYEFLSIPRTAHLWQHCNLQLAEAIRMQDVDTKIAIQKDFFHTDIENLSTTKDYDWAGLNITRTMTSILAWTIIIDSALLNQRFLEEMQATHLAKGCSSAPPGWVPLFLPHPPPDVCQLFNEFVRCRWPLHIFALDPDTEDQNVGDSFSLRREMQLALSVAFTSGRINANNFTRFVRRIEVDIDTIAINRTIIGFSHGDDTFGWRFYPRVQTPPIDSNLEAFFRDLLIGGYGPDYYLRRRRLENGVRECVALVIMPSFVPFLDLEMTGNWFRLANPKCKTLDLKQTMSLSRSVQSIQQSALSARDQHCYRPGDIELMLRRLDQLSHRLPLQRQLINVPSENTHGGFELLSAGVTNLAPELIGWYGAPGINPNGETSLFLVGDNFSVDQTRVIVGGLLLDPSCKVDCSTPGRDPASCVCVAPASPAKGAATPPAPTTPGGSTTPELLPAPKPVGSGAGSALPSSQSHASPLPGSESDTGVVQAGFRCRRQEPRPLPASSINILSLPSLPQSPAVQAAIAGTQAALAGVQAANAGAQAANAVGTSMSTTTSVAQTAATNTQSSSPGNSPASSTQTSATNTQAANASSSQAGSAGSQAANSGAQAAVKGAQAAVAGAQAAVADAQAASMTSIATTLAYDVPHFQMELLSRQVMRIVIPRGVYHKDGFVDVHIATPYGVSPHLSIPILCDTPQAVPSPAYGFSVDANSKVTINYMLLRKAVNQGNPTYETVFVGNDSKDAILIDWNSPTGSILTPANADFTFTFQGKDLQTISVSNIAANNPDGKGGANKGTAGPKAKGGYFEISGSDLVKFSRDLFTPLVLGKDARVFATDDTLPLSLTTKSIMIRLNNKAAQHVTAPVPTSNQLTVQFVLVPPSAALDDGSGKNQNVILDYKKDAMGRLFFSNPQQFSDLRINLPGISNKEGVTAQIQLHGFNAGSDLVEAKFIPAEGENSYKLDPDAKPNFADSLAKKINDKAEITALAMNVSSLFFKPILTSPALYRQGVPDPLIPPAIQNERITVRFNGTTYLVPDIGVTGSLTILQQPIKKN